MKSKFEFLGKSFFPILFIVIGIFVLISGARTQQNGWFIISGAVIAVIGVLFMIMFLNGTSNKYFKIVGYTAIPLIFVMGFLTYRSVMDTIDFQRETKRRDEMVISRLKDIREAQFIFKAENDSFAPNFDILMKFLKEGKMKVVKAIGTVHDSLLTTRTLKEAEMFALKMGYIKRDTMYMNIIDTIQNKLVNPLDSLKYIPFSGGAEFKMDAARIEQGRVRVPVFEVRADLNLIYRGMDQVMVANKLSEEDKSELKLGDMTKPVTSGNWE